MDIDFNVYHYDYSKRDGNLDSKASGVVKSEKFFPYFIKNGEKLIFKPLSKTKPLTTPYFAYSEVVWSNILNNFFDKDIPIYRLAICDGYEEEVPKYRNVGTIVPSIVEEEEHLVNLYQFFNLYPDKNVNINKYINFCGKQYDYTFFKESRFFHKHPEVSKEVDRQYLYSLLRADQNYHYENISFVYDGNLFKRVASPIDHEFSTMFMFIDNDENHLYLYGEYINMLINDDSIISKNIDSIIDTNKDVALEFLEKLKVMIKYFSENKLELKNDNYIYPFSSDDYLVGEKRYKNNLEEEANRLDSVLKRELIEPDKVQKIIRQEISSSAYVLEKRLEKKLTKHSYF